MAATTVVLFLVVVVFSVSAGGGSSYSSPYVSPTTLPQNYENMVTSFKIFVYSSKPFSFPDAPASLFYNSLLRSPFLTQNADEAHLFLLPFSPDTSTRSLARLVRELRNTYPYWNRTLGADHFFVSPNGIDYSSDRNTLELKKNSVQISLFPVVSGYFIPHKDITLPPLSTSPIQENSTTFSFLGHLKWDGKTEPNLVKELKLDADFLVEEKLEKSNSKFCLFLYHGDVSGIVGAMASGCVPVIIVDRPIQDLPLMDILRWSDFGLLVAGGAGRLKELLLDVSEEKYAEMRKLGVAASKHLVWNEEPQPLDAFHMVMYQLWLRRHAVRYARRELV